MTDKQIDPEKRDSGNQKTEISDDNSDESVRLRLLDGAGASKEASDAMPPAGRFNSREVLGALAANEDGDSELFKAIFKDQFCFDHATGTWYYWNDHHWRADRLKQCMSSIKEVIAEYGTERNRQAWAKTNAKKNGKDDEAASCEANIKMLTERMNRLQTLQRKKNVLSLSKNGVGSLGIPGDGWDKNNLVVGCKNGVIDLTSGEMRPGHPDDFIRTVSPVEWKGVEEPCDNWNRFMHEIFDWDYELVAYMRRLLGYAISGLTTEHVYPILYGEHGRNGKSTLIETLNYILGDFAYKVPTEFMLQNQIKNSSKAPDAVTVAFQGKRLVWAVETNESEQLNTAKIKELSGSDTLTARAPYDKHPVKFRPTHLLLLLTNRKPKAPANDDAFWTRVNLIPFELSFHVAPDPGNSLHRKADPYLPEKLKTEASGILAWLVRGFMEWQEIGLKPPKKITTATKEYRQSEDIIGAFISDACVQGQNIQIKASILYRGYKSWCVANGYRPVSSKRFGSEMRKRFESKKNNVIYYLGIDLADEEYL